MKIFTISLLLLLVCLSLEQVEGRHLSHRQSHIMNDEEDVLMDEPENLMVSDGKQLDPNRHSGNCHNIDVVRTERILVPPDSYVDVTYTVTEKVCY